MKIIDTHQHLWDLERFSYSWCARVPQLNRSFQIADYLRETSDVELVKFIHVEADVDEPYVLAETQYILSLAEQTEKLAGIVARVRPGQREFAAETARIVAAGHPRLKGVRRVLHTKPDNTARDPLLIDHIRSLEQYSLSFDICVLSRQLPEARALVEACPSVLFILDHCGNPRIREHEQEPWRTNISALAACPNIVCKISGLVTNADHEKWTAADLRPYVDHVIECFGWDRVMFGSDWPVCTLAAGFTQWLDALLFLTVDAGETERRKLFQENAERVYRL